MSKKSKRISRRLWKADSRRDISKDGLIADAYTDAALAVRRVLASETLETAQAEPVGVSLMSMPKSKVRNSMGSSLPRDGIRPCSASKCSRNGSEL
jgi:hypothetical protein